MTVYRSAADAITPPDAHRVLAAHVPVAHTGRCRVCDVVDCRLRAVALLALRAYDELPRRRPGATRPELTGARRLYAKPPRT